MTINLLLSRLYSSIPESTRALPGSVLMSASELFQRIRRQKNIPANQRQVIYDPRRMKPLVVMPPLVVRPATVPEIKIELEQWQDEVKGLPEFDARVKASEKIFQCYSSESDRLDLAGLGLTTLPSCIGQCSKVKLLILTNNQLTSLPNSIGNLSQLERLFALNNRLDFLPDSIGNCLKLKFLYLENNHLIALPDSLEKCSDLEELHASENLLISLPDLAKFPKLEWLNLRHNQLASIPESIGKCLELKRCSVSHNCLNSLPESLGNCSKLLTLFASENHLASLPESLGNCSQLVDLFLSDNHLRSLPESIGNCSPLERLDLSKNLLNALPTSIRNLASLRSLQLGENPIYYPLPQWFIDLAPRVGIEMDPPVPEGGFVRAYDMIKDLGLIIRPTVARVAHESAPAFGPKISELLQRLGARVVEPDINFSQMNHFALHREVSEGLEAIQNRAIPVSIPAQLLENAKPGFLIQKIKNFAENVMANSQGLVLPGGPDVEREFYSRWEDCNVVDYRRSIAEFALIAAAAKLQKPVIGTCRGAQMLNVYFGGTLKEVGAQSYWKYLKFAKSSKKESLERALKESVLPAFACHYQACDEIAPGFEVAMKIENIPELIMSKDGSMIGTQVHPEAPAEEGVYSNFIRIYELFFQKMPKPAHSF